MELSKNYSHSSNPRYGYRVLDKFLGIFQKYETIPIDGRPTRIKKFKSFSADSVEDAVVNYLRYKKGVTGLHSIHLNVIASKNEIDTTLDSLVRKQVISVEKAKEHGFIEKPSAVEDMFTKPYLVGLAYGN